MTARNSRATTVRVLESTMPWEPVCTDLFSEDALSTYKRRVSALEMYIAGASLSVIKLQTKIGGNYLRKLIAKCLLVDARGVVYGYTALIPNIQIKTYKRTAPVTPRIGGSGLSGVLGLLFQQYPDLEDYLRALILKREKPQPGTGNVVIQEAAIKPKAVHHSFIKFLEKKSHPKDAWPYTTQSYGVKTISEFTRRVRAENFDRAVHVIGDVSAVAHLAVGRGKSTLANLKNLYDSVVIDSHTIDSEFVIAFENSSGLVSSVELKRLHVIAASEPSSIAVLWFHVVYGLDADAEDVISLLREMLSRNLPKPDVLIPDLELKPGAGFPTEIYPEIACVIPSVLRLDNALAHLSTKVSCELRKELGWAVEYGPPKHFERRPGIERLFLDFEHELFQRLVSTVGSRPGRTSGNSAGKAAVKYNIKSSYLEQLCYTVFANHNAEPTEGKGFLSPLEVIGQRLRQGNNHFIPRYLPADKMNTIALALRSERRTVRGSIEKGIRPYVNFERARYSNDELREASSLINQAIILRINESDVRTIYGYRLDGRSLGALKVEGHWQDVKHSRKTRKAVNSGKRKKILSNVEGQSAVVVFHNHLATELENSLQAKPKSKKLASQLDRLRHEMGWSTNVENRGGTTSTTDVPAHPAPEREWVLPEDSVDIDALIKKI